jgi:DNA-binding MarR family transcriptional regulator
MEISLYSADNSTRKGEAPVSRKAFLEMFQAYRETVGQAFPKRDPISVLKVIEQCAAQTTQVAITKATGVRSAEVNKIVAQAVEKGWVHRESSRSSSGAKTVFLIKEGRQILAKFDLQCVAACTSVPSPVTQNKKRQSKNRRTAAQTITLFAIGEQS